MPKNPIRFVHILTIWRERPADPDQPALWRFSLEDVHAGERRGFATLEALTAFLRARLADDKPPPPADPDQPAT